MTFYITCNLADAFIQSDLQLIRVVVRELYGVKGLAKGPNSCADLIVATGSNHRPCWSKSNSLTTTLQAARRHPEMVVDKLNT